MAYIKIDSVNHPLFAECRNIYCNNFPIEEQRSMEEQERIFKMFPNYSFYAITNNKSVVGFIAFWRFSNCYFGEHVAIKKKGNGIGSQAIEFLKQKADEERVPVLLEIELPDNSKRIRRASFYTRLDFDMSPIKHFQPPFHKDTEPLELKIMCYPYVINEAEYKVFRKEYDKIMPDFSTTESGNSEICATGLYANENTTEDAKEENTEEPAYKLQKFKDLNLSRNILQGIEELGYENPTPVQERIIPTILSESGDIVCLAQTGTGKTAAFGLPVLQKIENSLSGKELKESIKDYEQHNTDPDKKWYSFFEKKTQVLVLSPTRELCRQITQDLKNYSKYVEGIRIVSVYGGASIEQQIKALRKTPQIIVATPGRMLDLLKRKAADISGIHTLILDEADEMLNMGFKEELDGILESAPENKQVLLFSATMPFEVERIAKNYMKEAQTVTVGERNSGSDNVKHYYFIVHEKARYDALKRIVDYYPDIYGIIFCRTKKETQDIASSLVKDGYDADALHGDLSQSQRDHVMLRFKSRNLQTLVATDVAARGIDVNNLSHVINYNLPDEIEQYTHRSGRTGRADKTGKSIVIINSKECHKIRRIEKIIGKEFSKSKIPSGEEVCSKQLLSLIDKVERIPVSDKIGEYMPLVTERWRNLSREEIIQKFIACEFNRFIEYYKNAPDLNISHKRERGDREDNDNRENRNPSENKEGREAKGKEKGKERGKGRSKSDDLPLKEAEKGYTWVRLNIGEKNRVTARHLVRMISTIGVGKHGIGKIDIRHNCSYIAIGDKAAEYVVEQTNNSDYKGIRLRSSIVKP